MKSGSIIIFLLFFSYSLRAQPPVQGGQSAAAPSTNEDENIPKPLLPVFNLVNAENVIEAKRVLDSLIQTAPDEIDFLSTKIIFHLQYRQFEDACVLIHRVVSLADRKGYTRFTTKEELQGLKKEYCPSE